MMGLKSWLGIIFIGATVWLASCGQSGGTSGKGKPERVVMLNVSYDPTREFYREYNPFFQHYWQKTHGREADIRLSNGGSGKQSLTVQNGLKADVVTLALASDIDALHHSKAGRQLLSADWQKALPHNSTPYTSTIVFLVRKGNPKQIHDWDDLVKGDVQIITANPKTSGGARWNFLSAWAYAQEKGGDAAAEQFVSELYRRVPVMDAGARGSTITFTRRGLGDVLLVWENEAHLALQENPNQFEIITPSISMLCEPPVAVVSAVAKEKGTEQIAKTYLEMLYSKEAQRMAARHFYRPTDEAVRAEFKTRFPDLKLVGIDETFGGWRKAQARFFNDGGVFDKIYRPQS